MLPRKTSALTGLAGLAVLYLSGCAVYVPTVPSTPLVRARQLEAGANIRAFSSLEATAAYSPVNHLLVNIETSYRQANWSTTSSGVTTTGSDVNRQASVGLGAYRETTGPTPWYLAGVVGFGAASTSIHDLDLQYPLPQSSSQYVGQYVRYYGQVYAAATQSERLTTGGSIRATWVHYNNLRQNVKVLASPGTKVFLEPAFFVRKGQGPLQLQGTFGLSMPFSGATDELTKIVNPTSLLASIGVVFRPHLLGQAKVLTRKYYKQ